MSLRVCVLVCLTALASTIGCAMRERARADAPSPEATIAVLGTVRTLHHEADLYEAAGDLAAASGSIHRIVSMDLPQGMAEGEDLRADAWGRLAELSLRQGAPDEALAETATGIGAAHRESVLRARLFMVRGQALGVLADHASTAGDRTAADSRRAEALQAYETSIQINQHVLSRWTHGGHP